jgi:hypothetical protein
MDHIVCLDAGTMELENMLNGTKSMILRGNDQSGYHYRNVVEGDSLWFMNGRDTGDIKAKAVVSAVYITEKLSVEESYKLIIRNQDKLQLQDNQFYAVAGKPYLALISLTKIEAVEPFRPGNPDPGINDDWFTAGKIIIPFSGS